jgi:aryl-alcohol dehydrogenase-like predicted oxidoreductase
MSPKSRGPCSAEALGMTLGMQRAMVHEMSLNCPDRMDLDVRNLRFRSQSDRQRSRLDAIARKHNAVPSQIAVAWVLWRSQVILPIPGMSKVKHLEENAAAANIQFSDDEFAVPDEAGRA